jgi:hemerythrin-like domain-containing protein
MGQTLGAARRTLEVNIDMQVSVPNMSETGQPAHDQQRPSAVLKAEHQIILRVIGVLQRLVHRSERGEGFDHSALARCVEFFRLFADACHHAKEEDLLFPVLESRGIPKDGGPIGVMLYEHSVARQLTADMADALGFVRTSEGEGRKRFHAAAHEYIELLTHHIFKEDNVLFNMGDRVLSEEDQRSLCGRFCEVGCKTFGGKTRRQLEHLADDLESTCAPSHE